ncbi:ThiF family adenylyltransferase [Nonomuraea maheshkhaliensis]|uniref:HesA/MoeB/ThiF family protein n=1 Tax=Nonomuraea maheshkhaliensis TaxID=419590 RepID=UPI0031F7E667
MYTIMTTESTTAWRLRGRVQLLPMPESLILRLGERTLRIVPFAEREEQIMHLLAEGVTDGERRLSGDGGRAQEIFDLCKNAGFLETAPSDTGLTDADLARYDRTLHYFSEFETANGPSRYERLRKLLSTRVVVVGSGGMASWLLYGLACCGVGELVVVDPDVVEASNLNRSILFDEADIGRPKVEAAEERLRRFAPRCRVRPVQATVTDAGSIAELVADADLIVGAADQPVWLIRQWLAEACRTAGRPLLHPSGLRVGPFYLPGQSACPMCEWAEQAEARPGFPSVVERLRRLPRGTSGSLAPWASVTASVATMEVLRYLGRLGPPITVNALWEWRPDSTSAIRPLMPHPKCPVCSGEGRAGYGRGDS